MVSVLVSACGSEREEATPEPPATPAPAPAAATPEPAAPAPAPAVPAGGGDADGLAIVRDAFRTTFESGPYRVRTEGTYTQTGRAATEMSMVTENVPPDRVHVEMNMAGAPPNEIVRIGERAWMKLGGRGFMEMPVGAAPSQPAAHELMLRALDGGQLVVEPLDAVVREGTRYDAYRVTGTFVAPGGAMTGQGTVLVDPSTRHISRIESDFSNASTRFQATNVIELDPSIRVEPPTP
jgi:hypothetical protein